jgi:RimJ/RimL family protein N-acetyltransferase
MTFIFRKIYNHWSFFRNGNSAERFNLILSHFNRIIIFLRLWNWFAILGKHYFFSLDSFTQRNKTEPFPAEEFPFQISIATTPDIIPQLLECMEGSSDYDYLTREEIIEKFNELLQQGSKVCAVRENDDVIGFFWITVRYYYVPCVRCKIALELKEETAFIEFIFIKASHRRKNIYSMMVKQLVRLYPNTRFFCLVNSFNLPSIKAQLRLGFKPSGSLFYFRFFRCLLATMRFEKTRQWLFHPKENIPYPIKVQ